MVLSHSLSCLSPPPFFTLFPLLHVHVLYTHSFFTSSRPSQSSLPYALADFDTFSRCTPSPFTPTPSTDSSLLYTPSSLTLPVFTLPFLLYNYSHSFSHLFSSSHPICPLQDYTQTSPSYSLLYSLSSFALVCEQPLLPSLKATKPRSCLFFHNAVAVFPKSS